MDSLTQLLVQRQLTPQEPQFPTAPVLPTPTTHIPPKAQRWANAQQLQDAYRGDWTPNPVLLRATQGK